MRNSDNIRYSLKCSLLRLGSPAMKAWNRAKCRNLPDAIFVWIPKTAGTSINHSLAGLGMQKFKSLEKVRYLFSGRGMVTFDHQSIPRLVEVGAVQQDFVENAFKFSFVRDPYDRCASLYRYLRRWKRVPEGMGYLEFVETLQRELHLNGSMPHLPEEDMSPRLRSKGREFRNGSNCVHQVGLYNVLGWSQCRPQLDWLKGLGSLKDIHIGRVENADGDYAQIITALSERSSRIPSSGVTLPRLNATNATETEKVSHDPAIRRIVEEIYAEDFEAFGY